MRTEYVPVTKYEAYEVLGMYYGQYKPEEVEHLIESGEIVRRFTGAGGVLGLSTLCKGPNYPENKTYERG